MPITSPLRFCYLQHQEPEKSAKPLSVKWDPAEPDSIGVAFDDGTYLVWKYSNGLKKLYNLQQSAMPLPTFDSDKDINATLPDAYGVTDPRPVTSPWLDFSFALVYDHREIFFAFNNSNKVHRSYLPDPSNVDMEGYTSGSGVFEFAAHRLPITSFTTSPLIENEPPRLLTGSEDGTIILWDASAPCDDDLRTIGDRTIHVINAHEGSVTDVAFAGLEFYISSGQDQAIRIWNINNGEQACYFHTEKVLLSKIECGPLSKGSYAIVAGSERGSIFMWQMDLPQNGNEDDEDLDESLKITDANDYISVRLVGMADHTERPISSISLFPINSRYGENDGVGVACGNKEGGLNMYRYGRSSLLDAPGEIDAKDENINFKNMPTLALELMHQAKYGSSMLSTQARYELNLNRVPSTVNSSEVVLLLSCTSEGEVDVLKVPPPGHRTKTETLVSKNGERGLSLLVTLNNLENEEENIDIKEVEERNRHQESPKRQSTMSPQRSPTKQPQNAGGKNGGNVRFGAGFETVLSITRSKKSSEEKPKEEIPEPEPHPMITYNQVGLPTEEDLENADAWAEEEFARSTDEESSNLRNAAKTPSSKKPVFSTNRSQLKQKQKLHGPKIAKTFYNPQRARALIEVEKNYRADYHAVETGSDDIQKLGFHGGDPPYFSKTAFPISELQEPVLQSSIALRNTIAKLNSAKFDKRAAIRDTVVPIDPRNVNFKRQTKYMGLVDVNAPTPVKTRTVRKQVSKKYLKQRLNNKNKLDVFDAPGLKAFQKAESTLKDKVDFYAPAEPKLFFNEIDRMGVGASSRSRFNMNSGY